MHWSCNSGWRYEHDDITVEHVLRDGCPKWNCQLLETQLTHLSWINESISYQISVITSSRHTTVLEAALLPAKPSWCSRSIYLSAKRTFALHVSLCKTWQLTKGDTTTSNASQWKAELRICRQTWIQWHRKNVRGSIIPYHISNGLLRHPHMIADQS